MNAAQNGDARHAALASRTRRDLLELVAASAEPLGAADVASRVNLHITTVRFHLDQLEAAHLIRRDVERDGRRGRPRVVYRAAPASAHSSVHRQLIQVLAGALATDPDGGRERAVHAGEDWADALLAQATGSPPRSASQGGAATTDPAKPLVDVLDSVGFEPELSARNREAGTSGGERVVDLMACPFRQAALDHPNVVCSVHRGLIAGTLERMGHDRGEASLHPFVQPELCTVTLRGSLADPVR
jgi:predicted ArsR family transcriptional regulator